MFFFFFSSRRRHTRYWRDWSSDVCSSDLQHEVPLELGALGRRDDDVLELADAGRDAVDRRRARGEPLHETPPRDERARRAGRQANLLAAAGDGPGRPAAQPAALQIEQPVGI